MQWGLFLFLKGPYSIPSALIIETKMHHDVASAWYQNAVVSGLSIMAEIPLACRRPTPRRSRLSETTASEQLPLTPRPPPAAAERNYRF